MEDFRIGRKTTSAEKQVFATTTSQVLVPFSADRVALVIGCPATNVLSLSRLPGQNFGNGLILGTLGAPLVLDVQRHGDLVRGPYYVTLNGGSEWITFWETHLGET